MSSPPVQHEDEAPRETLKLDLQCIASTSVFPHGQITNNKTSDASLHNHSKYEQNFFKEAQMSADGSTIVSHNDDRTLRTFFLPEDLADEHKQPHALTASTILHSPTNIQSYSIYPGFHKDYSNTTFILSASNDQPLRLTNALQPASSPFTYPYIHPKTEVYQAPNSLAWHPDGTHFIAGAKGSLAIFDISRDGSGPIATHNNNPRNPQTAVSSMRDSGLIMSLAVCPHTGLLAAGSSNRTIGLFSASGHGSCETSFSVASERGHSSPSNDSTHSGTGITSLSWTPDGTYLLVAERQSSGIHVYDVRNQLCRVAWLSGRHALTTQRLGFSTVQVQSGLEVWAGGMDGGVRMWRNPAESEGEQEPDAVFEGLHGAPVGSAVWNAEGNVMATCSGQRRFGGLVEADADADEEERPADSLKVWKA